MSRVLNRVASTNPSVIAGSLVANGRVYIANPAGVYFQGTAIVNVAELVAAAGSITNTDFLAGVDHFTSLNGSVVNEGQLNADAVTLLGLRVANHGEINADGGAILLIAGDDVWLTRHGSPILIKLSTAAPEAGPAVENTGAIRARGGIARMAAGDGLGHAIQAAGVIQAQQIVLEGGDGSLVTVTGVLDASTRIAMAITLSCRLCQSVCEKFLEDFTLN